MHEFICYAIPKMKSLNLYSLDNIALLMNHINSIICSDLDNNKCSNKLIEENDDNVQGLMRS